MIIVKTMMDTGSALEAKKQATTKSSIGDFVEKLDRAAEENRTNAQPAKTSNKDAAQAQDTEYETVEDMTDDVEEPDEVNSGDRQADVFAVLPILNGEEANITNNQPVTETIEPGFLIAQEIHVETPTMPEAEMPGETPSPSMPVTEEEPNVSFGTKVAELTLDDTAKQDATVKTPVVVEPQQKTDGMEQVATQQIDEPQAEKDTAAKPIATPKQDATVEIPTDVEAEAAEFLKQTMQELDTTLKQAKVTDTDVNIAQETEIESEITTKTAMTQEDGEQSAAQKKESAPIIQQPVTATVAQDGKVEFRQAMQELPQEQQAQIKQSVQTQIIDQVRTQVTQEKTEFYLQLKPEHLGGLSIMLAAEEKGIIAKMMTASKDVHMMLQNDMTQIQESLRERGINVVQMEIVYDQMASATGSQDTQHGQERGTQAPGFHGRMPESMESATAAFLYDELSTYEVLAEHGGSVEFSA